ncbi:hypothetical protein ZWY2020_016305 [Hordeum vulgare]|nr:hypothetical protein ZWY2020_016305 [Hordeum vulgare]
MDPSEIPHRVNLFPNTPCSDEETLQQSARPFDPVSKVLGDDDLLMEILLLIGCPTTLVCAALVCKKWFCHASDPAFLCRFSKLHPPCLLGFYVNTRIDLSRFVPMLPQPAEFDAVIRRASSSLDKYKLILDDWNDIVFTNKFKNHEEEPESIHIVLNPLCPERGMLPQGLVIGDHGTMLSQADDDSGVYLIHLKEPQLCIWLRTTDNWLLVDTICLREMKLCKVYELTSEDQWFGPIQPCMTIWPPTFPALKDDPASDAT